MLDNESIYNAVYLYFLADYSENENDYKNNNTIIKKYGKIEDWNTSKVTDMSYLFRNDTIF
jgi:hypothetical protein